MQAPQNSSYSQAACHFDQFLARMSCVKALNHYRVGIKLNSASYRFMFKHLHFTQTPPIPANTFSQYSSQLLLPPNSVTIFLHPQLYLYIIMLQTTLYTETSPRYRTISSIMQRSWEKRKGSIRNTHPILIRYPALKTKHQANMSSICTQVHCLKGKANALSFTTYGKVYKSKCLLIG